MDYSTKEEVLPDDEASSRFLMRDFDNQKEYLTSQIRDLRKEIEILAKTLPVSISKGKYSKRNASSPTIIYAKKSKIRF
ncbi:hypothetical protein NPIL_61191 [Nephila pilipes]|uniref:Uncharacterized protein n=1 Tax=Nephila pilipes TaxID=299642 RepID=A0A8X6P251_NEPPI|nr:hypothetical protein NPIL_61191 [Nephila pilipes]